MGPASDGCGITVVFGNATYPEIAWHGTLRGGRYLVELKGGPQVV